jgi:sugar/nucleoside kinase (ribokinase family)
MLDVVCAESPPRGSRVHADVSVRAGGSAVNAASAAVASGASASVIGRIGVDLSGDLIAAALADRGIGAQLARDTELPTGAAVALTVGPSSATVVAYRGANARLSPEDIPEVIDAQALFVSGFALFQSGSARAARAALERFTGDWAGVDVASPNLAAAAAEADFYETTRGASVLLATAEEARALTGAGPEDAVRVLALRFPVACIKLGEEGAIVAQGDRVERHAVEPVARQSPFGAGDAFGAALLVALAKGDPLMRALELACQAGARAASTSPILM